MERLKVLGTWVILVIAFYIFTNVIIYICLNGEEIGGTIYNMTHQEQINDEAKKEN